MDALFSEHGVIVGVRHVAFSEDVRRFWVHGMNSMVDLGDTYLLRGVLKCWQGETLTGDGGDDGVCLFLFSEVCHVSHVGPRFKVG